MRANLSMMKIYKGLVLMFIFLFPFIHFPSMPHGYEYPKFVFLVASVLFLSIFYLAICFRNRKLPNSYTKIDLFIIIFIIYLAFVDIIGLDMRTSFLGSEFRFQGFVSYLSVILLYLIVRSLRFSLKVLGIFFAFCVASLSVTSIFMHFSAIQDRMIGTIGSPNSLGIHLVLLLTLVIFLPKLSKKQDIYLDWLLVFVAAFSVYLTDSRTAMLGLFFVVIVKVFVWLRPKLKGNEKLLIFPAIIVVVFCAGTTLYLNYEKRGSQWDNRSIIWEHGLKAIAKSPIVGYGQENFELIFPSNLKLKVDSAHNYLLELAVAGGIPLMIIKLVIFVSAIRNSREILGRVFIFTFLIVSFFNPLSLSSIMLLWVVLGLIQMESKVGAPTKSGPRMFP